MNCIDLTGQKFGTWTVIERGPNEKGAVMWLCRCDCGTEKYVRGFTLKNGKSTGCRKCIWKTKDHPRLHKDGSRRYMDGKETKTFRRWRSMIERCNNPNNKSYKNYGARGITVCEEWKNSFQAYFDYISKLEHFGEENRTLDRINNDGGYCPGNVRWATKSEQERNKRSYVRGWHRNRNGSTLGQDEGK